MAVNKYFEKTFLEEVEEILRFKDPNCVKAIIILRRARRRGLKG